MSGPSKSALRPLPIPGDLRLLIRFIDLAVTERCHTYLCVLDCVAPDVNSS
jgi:hypothetical protein